MINPTHYMHPGDEYVFEKALQNDKTLKISCKIEKNKSQWQAIVDLTISRLSSAPITLQRTFAIDGHKFVGIYDPLFEITGTTENFADPKAPFLPEATAAGYSNMHLLALTPYPNAVVLSAKVKALSSSVFIPLEVPSATKKSLSTPTTSVLQAATEVHSAENTETPSPTSSSRLLGPEKPKNSPGAIIGNKGTSSSMPLNSDPSSSGCIIC